MRVLLKDIMVIAPNFKKRLSGVTSTIIQLIPLQQKLGIKIATLGTGLPSNLPALSWFSVMGLWKRPYPKSWRIWHARRNVEMIAGIIFRDLLRMKIKLIFTSAAQRHHQPFTKWLIRKMDRVIATSARSGSFLEVPYNVIMHGIDLERFHPPRDQGDYYNAAALPGKFAVGCFGRIRHQKGTDLFVDAMIELLPQFPEWTAIIAGRVTKEHHDFAEAMKNKVNAAGLSHRILFIGEVADIRIWYRRISLYVAPSRNEGFGLTPLEAMASRTAVVASDAGAYRELINDEFGSVVEAGDGDALTTAIKPYLANIEQTLIKGQLAEQFVSKNFPLEKEARAIGLIYSELSAAI